jgi:hypothetical protein
VFDFEAVLKLIIVVGIGAGMFLVIAFGVKTLFFRKRPKAVDEEQLDGLDERLLRTEAKLSELEERLDFTERMLTEARARGRIDRV